MIHDLVAAIGQHRQRGFFREIVNVAKSRSWRHDGTRTQYALHGHFQRNVKHLVASFRTQVTHERERILYMFHDIDAQGQIRDL